MSFEHVANQVKNSLNTWWDSLFSRNDGFKYSKELVLALGVLCAGSGAFFAHKWYVGYRERAAQKDFSLYIAEFERAQKENTPVAWQQAASLFKVGFDQNASSYLAPYFLAYQADALFQSGDKAEALKVMDKVIGMMPATSPFIALYKTKQALLHLDMDDAALNEQAIAELKQLAADQGSIHADMAQFYLGRYYWVNDRVEDAKNIWQQLVETQKIEKIAPSPWAQEAAQFLDSIG